MKNTNLFKKNVILFIIFTLLLLSCFNTKEKKEIKIPKNKLNDKFFKSSRILDEYKDFDNLDELKLISVEKAGNKIIRLLLNYPVFNKNEVGKEFETSFFYFDPLINGKYIVRTNRIIDYVLDNSEEKKLTLLIPKKLTGIHGHKLNNDIKINFSMNTKNNNEIFYFANIPEAKEKYEKIIQTENEVSSEYINEKNKQDNYETLGYTDLKTEIDLDQNIKNSFTYKNIYSIKRKYKKLNKKDIVYIIKNYNSHQKIKEYFFKSKLPEFPNINNISNNGTKTALLIPESESGVFFCYQKIYYNKKNYKEFYQIYNFQVQKCFAINTENSILIHSINNNLKKNNQKITVYNKDGSIISDGNFDEENFYIFNNQNYKNIFVLIESSKIILKHFKLKSIKKINFNIHANFSNLENNILRINGLITGRKGQKINLNKTEVKVLLSQNNIDISEFVLEKIEKSGVFYFDIPVEMDKSSDINITFLIDGKKIKNYVINSLSNSDEFFKNPKNHVSDLLKIKDNIVFNKNPAVFFISEDYISKIDSIAYNVLLNNKIEQENLIDVKTEKINLKLPDKNGNYKIEFDILFNDGNAYSQIFEVEKITDIKNKSIQVKNDYYEIKNDKITMDIYNPFKNAHSFIIDYNNDIFLKKKIMLSYGLNTISMPKKKNTSVFNRIIMLYDVENDSTVCFLNKIDLLENNIKNFNYSENNDKSLNLDLSSLKGQNLLVQYSPLVSTFNNPFINSLYLYNDMFGMNMASEQMFPGEYINPGNKKSINLMGVNNRNYKLDIVGIGEKSREYYNTQTILSGQKIFVEFLGAEKINFFDSPVYEIIIQNESNKDMDLDIEIVSSNGIAEFKNKNILLKKGKTEIINFSISDFKMYMDSDLKINIYSFDDLIYSNSKKLKINYYNFVQSAQISGNIIDTRISEGYLKIPDDSFSNFEINLLFSSNRYLNYLKKNYFLDNINLNVFEIELLKFLDSYLENKYLENKFNMQNLNNYYIPGKGFKRNISDSLPGIESTFLYLFTAKQIKEIYEPAKINSIIKYNIANKKPEILKSDFLIFVLAEYGYLFEEIDKKYIENIKKYNRSILYYRYFEKYNIEYEYNNDFIKHIYYNDYKLSIHFFEILKNYFSISGKDLNEAYYYPYLIEGIIGKSILINRYEMKKNNSKIVFDFDSPLLGEFSEEISGDDDIIKNYSFQFLDSTSHKKKIIDYEIQKESGSSLYYLISANYNTDLKRNSSNNIMEIYTEWIGDENILDKNNLEFSKDRKYHVNLYLINNSFDRELILKPVECNGFKINLTDISLNNKSCTIINNDEDLYVKLDNLKPGVNVINYEIIPVFYGKYNLNNMIIFDIYDFKNYLCEGSEKININ